VWRLLGKHQVSSILSTAVDFVTMIATVELLGFSSVAGTITGATAGGITNFSLGRSWTFRARSGRVVPQAIRYALVSAASAGLNAIGEYLINIRLGVQYIAARVMVAVIVSIAWNFPMHRWFVFRQRGEAT
jgi:putative flippase GtrA